MLTDGYGNTTAWPVLSVGTHRILSYLPRNRPGKGVAFIGQARGHAPGYGAHREPDLSAIRWSRLLCAYVCLLQ